MVRISKAPEVRKQEILETAMKLFYIKGYEKTSMADIAKEMDVVPGLCYRYFKSKQDLFDTSMNQYVEECSQKFLEVIRDDKKTLEQRIDYMANLMETQEENSRYHNFYHKNGNEDLHQQLMIKIAKYLTPIVSEELKKISLKGEVQVENIEMVVNFIMYGQIGILSCVGISMKEKVKEIRKYIDLLLLSKL
ncbi:TetR/AcrR family transcriptional regulator [Clostridium oceanicum]|uniref:TetR/AcrR family transcriptional regulator n=1 Tax=Clostridium oceanicum TaxID=1543 RepID=A0ABP3UN24_9CLOT